MAIDRPLRTEIQDQEESALEIEVVNPEAVSIETEDGGVLIDFGNSLESELSEDHNANLADFIDERDLTSICLDLVSSYRADKESRSDWERSYVKGLDLLGLKNEDRTQPWDGACGVFHPLLTESVIKFQSQSIQEIFPARGPVKTAIVGKIDEKKTKQAERVQNYLNYSAYRKNDRVSVRDRKNALLSAISWQCF
jgi:hypothetical protein